MDYTIQEASTPQKFRYPHRKELPTNNLAKYDITSYTPEQGIHRNKVYTGTRYTPEQGIHRNKVYTGTRYTPEQGIHRNKVYTGILNHFIRDHCTTNDIITTEQAGRQKGKLGMPRPATHKQDGPG